MVMTEGRFGLFTGTQQSCLYNRVKHVHAYPVLCRAELVSHSREFGCTGLWTL